MRWIQPLRHTHLQPSLHASLRGFGVIVACVNLHGGGEYGEDCHRAGMLGKKQNVMDDFHSAATYPVDAGYTTANQIVPQGGSNGGMVISASLNQRPDLYGCVTAKVVVLDCLWYTTSAGASLGRGENGDRTEPVAFDYLKAYSLMHNADVTKYIRRHSLLQLTMTTACRPCTRSGMWLPCSTRRHVAGHY